MGLLPHVHRQRSSGHRRYTLADVSTAHTLACLRAAGMSLAQMRQYLDLVPQGAAAAPQAQHILAEQRAELVAQIQLLHERLEYLDHKVAYWKAIAANDRQEVAALAKQFADRVHATATNQGRRRTDRTDSEELAQ
jgi:DNA-binding transcriptional MerR regulator